ncbi:sigma-70 family RNA polymerase sigma factor [Cellulomonas bogoriensis]|uniref:Flagellar biosynthesis protein FliA n=1 Tax=Cellulomonas bogoriensis 69B4 = DSM 16987 TaxID=1386082 RepID=A0A0A0BXC9_9CELL|nr:sigma-70 family RNA polymerase sigma factor [Cellulomonas bogoriensis]KGM13063.1 flagellar biosynthesis protein FliA [Cellulomonas bogoriensis 69B4 = DSM 16987]
MTENTAANALVVENLALVGYHVNSMLSRVPSYVSRADLASAAHLALVQASRAYDEATGVPFGRYAALRIRGALVDELRGMDWISRGARRRVRRVNEVADELTASLGRVPSREELAEALGVAVSEIDTARSDADVRVLSIDGLEATGVEAVADGDLTPEDQVVATEKLHYLRAGVESLPDRLRHVVEQLFFHDRPVAEVAAELGVTQSRISQLRTEALALLKDGMNASLAPEMLPVADRPEGVAERRRRAYFAQVAARAAQQAGSGVALAAQGAPRHAGADEVLAVG